ncbi:hypothetical protein LCGC14_0334970 [marine sediment metagenome]|uniref:Uncharacterized protein n=1 Tax=marine sediment metagenome TaxID=412755 RepID=A0A0F9TL31_9ZZZZ
MSDQPTNDFNDWRLAYLRRKLTRLRKDPIGNKWSILSAQNALDYLLHGEDAAWRKKAGWT